MITTIAIGKIACIVKRNIVKQDEKISVVKSNYKNLKLMIVHIESTAYDS